MDSNLESSEKSSNGMLINAFGLFHIIKVHWLFALVTATSVSLIFTIILFMQEPIYSAEANLVIDISADAVVGLNKVEEKMPANSAILSSVMNTHIERIKSHSLAEKVFSRLTDAERQKLVSLSFGSKKIPELKIQLEQFKKGMNKVLKAIRVPDTQVIKIRINLKDQNLAKVLVNEYAFSYLKFQEKLRIDAIKQAVVFLDDQTIQLKNLMEKAELALQDYRISNDIVSADQSQEIEMQRLRDLGKSITNARMKLVHIESYINQINLVGDDINLTMDLSIFGDDQNIFNLYSDLQILQKEREVLNKTYLEKHPKMVNNYANQVAAESLLWKVIDQYAKRYLSEQSRLKNEIKSMDTELSRVKEESRRLESLARGDRLLALEVQAQRQIYDHMVARLNETTITSQLDSSTLRIMDLATLPIPKAWPNPQKIILVTAIIFLFILIFLPFIIELMDYRVRSFWDIEHYIGSPILADFLYYKNINDKEITQLLVSEKLMGREAVYGLYSAIRLKLGKFNKPISFLVTSSVSSEGKSVVSSILGSVFADQGYKTILIDADFRSPSQHIYNESDNHYGVMSCVESDELIDIDSFKKNKLLLNPVNGNDNYFILTSGGESKKSVKLFENTRFEKIISEIKKEFDIVIFDVPPVGLFHDAALVADYVDHTILVLRQYEATRQIARHSVNLMNKTKAKVLGTVFNGISNQLAAEGYSIHGSSSIHSECYQSKHNRSLIK
jgi:succinoglycan biosynthesis transport protein ExoP